MRITNKEVYDEIKKFREENAKGHAEMISHIQTTNGKVKLNRWIATTALSLTILVVGFLLNNSLNK